jgi:hypothetical protein
MTAQPRPCYRHRRRTAWMVSCPECTAYHLAAALERRDEELAAHHRTPAQASRPARAS